VHDLVKTVLLIESGASVTVHSLATNPVSPDSKVATLSFQIIPASLSDNFKNEWEFATLSDPKLDEVESDQRIRLVFDTHFSGFTTLQRTPDDECHIE
jgi:hypothetical protein